MRAFPFDIGEAKSQYLLPFFKTLFVIEGHFHSKTSIWYESCEVQCDLDFVCDNFTAESTQKVIA